MRKLRLKKDKSPPRLKKDTSESKQHGNGLTCPFCDCSDIGPDFDEAQYNKEGNLILWIKCEGCKEMWQETYKIISRSSPEYFYKLPF